MYHLMFILGNTKEMVRADNLYDEREIGKYKQDIVKV